MTPATSVGRLDRVAVAVDFSAPSLAAARWTALRFAPDAELLLVHAVDAARPPRFLEGRFPPLDRVLGMAREGAEDHLRPLAAELESERPGEVRWTIREGPAAEAIDGAATEFGADLVAIGEHGQRPGVWQLLGSTAERLVGSTRTPVLLARGAPRTAPTRILVPQEDAETQAESLRWAIALGERFGAEVTLFHAVHPSIYGHVRLVSGSAKADEVEREVEESARRWFEEHLAVAGADPDRVAIRISRGEPRMEVLAAAKRYGAELVVVGCRGHGAGAIARLVGGSVVTAVLRGSACPVLVVREDAGAAEGDAA